VVARHLWKIAFVNVSVVALAYLLIWPAAPNKPRELWFYVLVFVVAPVSGAIVGPALSERINLRALSWLLPPGCAILAAFALLWSASSVVLTIDAPGSFLTGFIAAWIAGALYLLLPQREGIAFRAIELVLTAAGVLALLLLFDYRLRTPTISYGPYLGPAVNALHGGIPMLDTFSQYGMAYLVFALAIAWSGYSLAAVAALASAFNVAYFGTATFIAWKLASRRAVPFLFAVAGVVAAVGNYPFDINYAPSAWGMRFLPLFLLLAVLIATGRSKRLLLPLIVPIASLWSAESCFASVCLIAGYLFVESRRRGISLLGSAFRASAALAYVALPHLAASAVSLLWYGRLPDYRSYFELIWAYTGDYWSASPEPGFRLWLFHIAAYTTVLAFAVSVRGPSESAKDKDTTALTCVSIVGVLQFTYFAGRSTTPQLVSVSLPLIILIVYAFANAAAALRLNPRSIPAASLFGATLFAAGLMAGSAGTKLARAIDPRPVLPLGTYESSNSHLLAACLQLHWSSCGIPIRRLVRPSQPSSEEDHVGGTEFRQAMEAYEAMTLLESQGARVHAFITETPTLYFYLRRRLPWGLSNPLNDGLSATITAKAVEAAKKDIKNGDYVLIGRANPLEPASADIKIVDAIRNKLTLCGDALQRQYPSLMLLRVGNDPCSAVTR
jgi:hypothetical protein